MTVFSASGSIDRRPTQAGADRFLVGVTVNGVRKSLGTYATEAEAEATLAGALAKLGNATRGRTLSSWGKSWLDDRETHGRHRAFDQDRSIWRRHIKGDQRSAVAHVAGRTARSLYARDLHRATRRRDFGAFAWAMCTSPGDLSSSCVTASVDQPKAGACGAVRCFHKRSRRSRCGDSASRVASMTVALPEGARLDIDPGLARSLPNSLRDKSIAPQTHQIHGAYRSGIRDLNPRPSAWEADALPTELIPPAESDSRVACLRQARMVIVAHRQDQEGSRQ